MRLLALIAALIFVLIAPSAISQETDDTWEAGRTLYNTLTRQDGTSVQAMVQHDVPLPVGTGACVSCHRRSGLGLAEGGERASDITGTSLFQYRDVPPVRPAYDDALFLRALVAGIDANGAPLSALMPRYRFTSEDADALVTYLRSLGADSAPGVTDTDLVIATIITPDSTEDERDALESIIPEYVAVKNGGSRHEQRRAEASARHFYGIKRYQAHRKWKHSFWYLTGPPENWGSQLRELLAKSPPFALVSGSIGQHADIVHNFCEQFQIACILPMTNVPPATETGFYSLYFSSGVRLEAQVIANFISKKQGSDGSGAVLIYNDDADGKAARESILEQLASKGATLPTSYSVNPGQVLSVGEWVRLLEASPVETLVPLISMTQMQNLISPKLDVGLLPQRIVTAQSFTNWSGSSNTVEVSRRVLHVYPYSLPNPGRSQFPREDVWLRTRGIELSDNVIAAKVLFACKVFGMALADIQSNFSREYLLESLEHGLDNNLLTSLYPHMSLGPDQRYLSRGAYLANLTEMQGQIVVTEGGWIQP